ncbi:toxin-activating lysine-acyltransferase [Xenorhabdus bovienii]|uniref:toxin-activating lysine-acyltransferase n=1 Tax=Xenorhabdus bovienii TaxID=40576 RepID=UPI00237C6D60|nr:toxin-activating lysine-acyltransferase [Xenorhabdus bovienii]MDE1475890.1 toxin-activating lysine-acyltransferase [Xenorhabdus bovienii]
MEKHIETQIGFFDALGMMTCLALRSPYHREWTLADIETNFLPALMKNQYKIYFDHNEHPKAFITWARVDDATHHGLIENGITPNANKWSSGHHLWFIDLVAPFGDAFKVVRDMQKNHFPNIHCHSIRRNLDGSIRRRSKWFSIVLDKEKL